MSFKFLTTAAGLVASALAVTVAQPAMAASLDFNNGDDVAVCDGLAVCNINGFTLEANPSPDAELSSKTVNGVNGLGVNFSPGNGGPGSQDEVDYFETLKITLDDPDIVAALDLVFLYHNPAFGDLVKEQAIVEVMDTDNNIFTGFLQVATATTANWVFNGNPSVVVNAKSNADEGGGGWFSISNPFGDIEVASISLKAPLDSGSPETQTFRYSDYSLGGITTESVPEPATVLGLGIIAAGIVTLRRRKQAEG